MYCVFFPCVTCYCAKNNCPPRLWLIDYWMSYLFCFWAPLVIYLDLQPQYYIGSVAPPFLSHFVLILNWSCCSLRVSLSLVRFLIRFSYFIRPTWTVFHSLITLPSATSSFRINEKPHIMRSLLCAHSDRWNCTYCEPPPPRSQSSEEVQDTVQQLQSTTLNDTIKSTNRFKCAVLPVNRAYHCSYYQL